MPGGKPFFDTNILIYALAKDDPRAETAEALIQAGGVVSVQVLNEFVAVARSKLRMSWNDVLDALRIFRVFFPSPVPVTFATHEAALSIARRYKVHIYDALVIAAALGASSKVLYSEDLHDGQVIAGVTIRNPFR